jgi:hypothetical protein
MDAKTELPPASDDQVCGKPAGWQAFMSDSVMEHFYRRHYPTDSLG